ncbi:hypothetical protein [Steroidobacter sp.]|uniref:S-methyl thiohydantoin desulfurase domain-containing protein n=1 Tax=Steroidobacter sp. TaxID=1978227 RepID=UPI0032C225DC
MHCGRRYGQRVSVLGLSAPAQMRTEAALDCFGPAAFRLPEPFLPIEDIAASMASNPSPPWH